MFAVKLGDLLLLSAIVALSVTCASAQEGPAPRDAAVRRSVPPDQRRVFFGELHLHTVMSLDAWTFGTRVTPDQAYKFARGETVMVPASQVAREQGIAATADVPARRAWPLDFTAVTDHSEFVGAMHELDDPNSTFSQSAIGKRIKDAVAKRAANLESAGNLRTAAGSLRNNPQGLKTRTRKLPLSTVPMCARLRTWPHRSSQGWRQSIQDGHRRCFGYP
jgi:hypothetical protein